MSEKIKPMITREFFRDAVAAVGTLAFEYAERTGVLRPNQTERLVAIYGSAAAHIYDKYLFNGEEGMKQFLEDHQLEDEDE